MRSTNVYKIEYKKYSSRGMTKSKNLLQ